MKRIQDAFERLHAEAGDLYQFLNRFREWVNTHIINYEIFLEDEWFDAETTIEYTLRSLDTFNIVIFAKDKYKNHRSQTGVWNLGEYVETYWTVEEPWGTLALFIEENGLPEYRHP